MKTISIPTNNRVQSLQRCLDAVRAAVGHESWALVFNCEPHQPVCDMVTRINWAPVYFHRNPCQMGCRVNTFLAANFAMSLGSEFNVYLEDDNVISRDALTLSDQFRESKLDGVVCFRRWQNSVTDETTKVMPSAHGLLGDGFAFRREQWELIRGFWFYNDPGMGGAMWDWSVGWGLDKLGIRQWRPMKQRSQNIGVIGTHTQGGGDPNHFSPRYEGMPVGKFTFEE